MPTLAVRVPAAVLAIMLQSAFSTAIVVSFALTQAWQATTETPNREKIITQGNIGDLHTTREAPEPWTYYPLAVGNVWKYTIANGGYFRIDIKNDSIINNNTYFLYHVSTFDADGSQINNRDYYVRYDTTHAIIFEYEEYGQMDHFFGYIPCEFDPADLEDVLCYQFNGTAEFHNVTYSIGDSTWVEASAYTVYPYFGWITYVSSLGEIYGSNKWIGYYELTYARVNNVEYGTEQFPVGSEPDASGPRLLTFEVYPNPTIGNVNTAISLSQPAYVRIEVFDVLGRRLAVLSDGTYEAGEHGIQFETGHLPSGLYLVRAELMPDSGVPHVFARRVTVVR